MIIFSSSLLSSIHINTSLYQWKPAYFNNTLLYIGQSVWEIYFCQMCSVCSEQLLECLIHISHHCTACTALHSKILDYKVTSFTLNTSLNDNVHCLGDFSQKMSWQGGSAKTDEGRSSKLWFCMTMVCTLYYGIH